MIVEVATVVEPGQGIVLGQVTVPLLAPPELILRDLPCRVVNEDPLDDGLARLLCREPNIGESPDRRTVSSSELQLIV